MGISERIKQIRTEAGLTQGAFAKELGPGFTQALISKYESGTDPTLDRLVKIAGFGHVSTDWILGLTEDRGCDESPIDEMGLDDETVTVLKKMVQEERDSYNAPFTTSGGKWDGRLMAEGIYLNRLLTSPHLRPLLFALNDLERIVRNYDSYISSIKKNDIPKVEKILSRYAAAELGFVSPVIADLDSLIQVKTNEAVLIAREIIRESAMVEYWTKTYPEKCARARADAKNEASDVKAYSMEELLKEFFKSVSKPDKEQGESGGDNGSD